LRLRGRPRRVLVVDDDDNAAVLAQVLLAPDDRVEMVGRARHGREALTMAAAVQPDVILMDLHMPVMGGTDATRRLREQGSTARIVVVTASEDVDEIRLAREAGADAFVVKPVDASGLVAVILAEVSES
jgi:CheY-like chemotaxis protein